MSPENNETASMLINPYYVLTFSELLFGDQKVEMAPEDWVKQNADLIKNTKPETWLTYLLAILENGIADNAAAIIIDPRKAVVISESLRGSHEPLVSQSSWLIANAKLMDELGAEKYLSLLLDVLQEDNTATV